MEIGSIILIFSCVDLFALAGSGQAGNSDNIKDASTPVGKNFADLTKHYSMFPYPTRRREDDATIQSAYLVKISSSLFGGKFSSVWKRSDLRILDAGGGTGDAVLTLARQLNKINKKAQVVHLDLSANAQAVVKERAEYWGVSYMIHFVHGSLLDSNLTASLGTFDFIESHGVLHHLVSPKDGLLALKRMLKPGGGMSIMVYGTYGRTGIYDVQRMARMLNPPSRDSEQKRLASLHALLKALPDTNRLRRNGLWEGIQHETSTDVGAYDLFLHSQDRAYTIDELYEWVETDCGLEITSFNTQGLYDPDLWLENSSAELRSRIARMNDQERRSMAELLHGTIQRHSFYAARSSSERKAASASGIVVAGGPTPVVAADTIPCLNFYDSKDNVHEFGQHYENFTVEVTRNVGRLSAGFPNDQKVRYVVNSMIQYPWAFGDCVKTYAEIWEDEIQGKGHSHIPLGIFLFGMESIAKLMQDWDDMVILTEPADGMPLLANVSKASKESKSDPQATERGRRGKGRRAAHQEL